MTKNIIVSGASSGIGFALALKFAQAGHQVLAISRREEKLIELKSKHANLSYIAIDLNDSELNSRISEHYTTEEKVHVLVNNAGQLINKPFLETSPLDFIDQYKSNLTSTVNLIQAVYPFMKGGGHIVNVSSMGGFQGSSKFAGLSAYSSSKGALSVLTECLAEEFREDEVSVNALALGAVQTEMLSKAFPDYKAPLEPEQMADYIMDFALKANIYLNGQILPVTSGNP